jgi:hypothetical protein
LLTRRHALAGELRLFECLCTAFCSLLPLFDITRALSLLLVLSSCAPANLLVSNRGRHGQPSRTAGCVLPAAAALHSLFSFVSPFRLSLLLSHTRLPPSLPARSEPSTAPNGRTAIGCTHRSSARAARRRRPVTFFVFVFAPGLCQADRRVGARSRTAGRGRSCHACSISAVVTHLLACAIAPAAVESVGEMCGRVRRKSESAGGPCRERKRERVVFLLVLSSLCLSSSISPLPSLGDIGASHARSLFFRAIPSKRKHNHGLLSHVGC